jgi:hypothetical protein
MPGPLTAIHPGKAGDIIFSMAIFKRLHTTHNTRVDLTIQPRASYNFSVSSAEWLVGLLQGQSYIRSVVIDDTPWDDHYKFNDARPFSLDFRRWSEEFSTERGQHNILENQFYWTNQQLPATYRIDKTGIDLPWIETPQTRETRFSQTTFVHRTNRDSTPDSKWKDELRDCENPLFIGTVAEHSEFIVKVQQIPHSIPISASELALWLASGKCLVASQSFPMALACSIGTPMVGFVTREFHDSVFIRENAEYRCHRMLVNEEYAVGM